MMTRKLLPARQYKQPLQKNCLAGVLLILLTLSMGVGCSHRPKAWGFPGAQGTIDRQKSRATIHDPFPLNDIGPEVVGGRPREFYSPQTEAAREANVPLQYRNLPPSY